MKRLVWTISGLDPSGGAGILADVRAIEALGAHAVAVVTALTVQDLERCDSVTPVAATELSRQIALLAVSMPPSVVKIGMLGSVENARVVAEFLRATRTTCVLDPVLASSSGRSFASDELREFIARELVPLAIVVTPNALEAAALGDCEAKAILLKGGHDASQDGFDSVVDHFRDAERGFSLATPRYEHAVRGTGCALASTIAAALANGQPLAEAVVTAKAQVARGIRLAESVSASERRVMRLLPWPVEGIDFPRIGPPGAFPPLERAIGFYPIVDRAAWVERLGPLGVPTMQIRIKDLAGPDLAREVRAAVRAAQTHDVRLFVNDHWRLAIEHGAYGVHLGQEDLAALSPSDLQALEVSGLRLGLSTHSYEELARALAAGPSYVALGPIFPTTLKSMRFAPQGARRLLEWKALIGDLAPLVAIGGITLESAPEVLAAGAEGIAVVSDVMQHATPEARARAWVARLKV